VRSRRLELITAAARAVYGDCRIAVMEKFRRQLRVGWGKVIIYLYRSYAWYLC
jgi:hypothetical protein